MTCPPSPRRDNWLGNSFATSKLAFNPALNEESFPVFTSTATNAEVGSIIIEAPKGKFVLLCFNFSM